MARVDPLALLCTIRGELPAGRLRRRLREWRGGVGLLVGLVLFGLACAGLYGLLHGRLEHWRDPFHAGRLACLRRRCLVGERPRTVVLLGSSRTHYGVRGGILEEQMREQTSAPVVAFNLGKPGAGPVMVLYTWQRMRREGIRPDLVLLEVSSFQLPEGSAVADTNEVMLPATVLSPPDRPFLEHYAPHRLAGLDEEWLTCRAVPWLGYRRAVVGSAIPRLLPVTMRQYPIPMVNECGDGIDWVTPCNTAARLLATQRSVQSIAAYLFGPVPGDRPRRALHQLLEECTREGIEVVLVLPPESSLLRQALAADKVREAERFTEQLAREHGTRIVDARRWLDDEDLADGVHSTRVGAERFTRRLGREVVLPWLASRR